MVRNAQENSAQRQRLHQPTLAESAGHQGSDRKGEGHREPDVPEIQNRWVEQHQDVVLQQRVRAGARGHPDRTRGERVGGTEAEHGEERQHHEHHDQRPTHEDIVGPFAESPRDRSGEARQRQHPQQDRPSSADHIAAKL